MKHDNERAARRNGAALAQLKGEPALYFSDLARRAIDTLGADLLNGRSGNAHVGPVNPLGDDLDPVQITRIEEFFSGQLEVVEPYAEAQIRELAFWRWVAFEGYGNTAPQSFPFHQEHLMVSTFFQTGWSLHEFLGGRTLEIGCGPLGMIDFIPAKVRIAFDPLNAQYDKLFAKCRSSSTRYLSRRNEVVALPGDFDLAVCHNVLDHTTDPDFWFNTMFDKLRDGKRFIIQLNLTLDALAQSDEHRRMHPSPFSYEQIMDWLSAKSGSFQHLVSDDATPDGEAYFLAWGNKTRDAAVNYHRRPD